MTINNRLLLEKHHFVEGKLISWFSLSVYTHVYGSIKALKYIIVINVYTSATISLVRNWFDMSSSPFEPHGNDHSSYPPVL